MARLENKNILILIPKDYYNEQELDPLMEHFQNEGASVHIASGKLKEAVGMKGGRVMPNLIIVDAMEGITGDSYVTGQTGTRQVKGVFHGVVVIGGKGARSYLWKDKLVTLLLSDRYRSEMVVAAIGTGIPCLATAGLLQSLESATPDDQKAVDLIDKNNALLVEDELVVCDRVITAKDASVVEKFAEAVCDAVEKTKVK